jgi:hypothetical protein
MFVSGCVPDEALRDQYLERCSIRDLAPTSLLAPTLDGKRPAISNGWGPCARVRDVAGRHQAERPASSVSHVDFGFDATRLYVRVDFPGRAIDLLASGREVSLKFVTPAGVRFSVRQEGGRLTGSFWDRLTAEPHWAPRGPGGAAIAAGTILELAIPLVDLGLAVGQTTAFFVAIYEAAARSSDIPQTVRSSSWFPTRCSRRVCGGPEASILRVRILGRLPLKSLRKPCTGGVCERYLSSLIMYVILT